MVMSCLTMYAILLSCFTLFIGKTFSAGSENEAATAEATATAENRQQDDRGRNKINPNVTIKGNVTYFPDGKITRFPKDSRMGNSHFNRGRNDGTAGNDFKKSFDISTERKSRHRRKRFDWETELDGEIVRNFVVWDTLEDSEREIRIRYNGMTAKETVMATGIDEETGNRQGLKLRQLTDGIRFVQLIYNFDDEIQDCEYLREKNVAKKFVDNFRRDVDEARASRKEVDESNVDEEEMEDEGKIERYFSGPEVEEEEEEKAETEAGFDGGRYRNVTFQIIRRSDDLPEELKRWLSYPLLKKECRENHKILKSLARDIRHGDDEAKKLAREHIERRKRDIMDVFLVPGTKWCGKGRRATKYTSLGGFSRTDKCCRIHDTMCPHWIGSLEEKYELFNWRINTIMHCRCDKRFRACLKMAKTGTANFVGKLFFNVVQTKCFILKPKEVCLKYSWWGKCEKKEYRKQAHLRDNVPY